MPYTAALKQLHDKVVRFFTQMEWAYQIEEERYYVQHGSTVLWIEPLAWKDGKALLRMSAVVVTEVQRREDLFERLSNWNEDLVFGRLFWRAVEGEEGVILLEHNLLGAFMDYEEFREALLFLTDSADELDDVLVEEFGGLRWID